MTDTTTGLALTAPSFGTVLSGLAPAVERARAFAVAARSESTRRAYAVQVRAFRAWCAEHGAPELAPESVALYLASRADHSSVATLAQALAALCETFAAAGEPSPRQAPALRETWKGIRRTRGVAQRQAAPLGPPELRRMVAAGKGLAGVRDRALLLLGFAGAFRRSELVALDVSDVQDDADGLVVAIRRSKTDQLGEGRKVGVPFGSDKNTCPVRSLREWLSTAGITDGALFRGVRRGDRLTLHRLDPGDVARVVQRCARRAGVPLDRLSGHSLRAGLATTAAKAGKSAHVIAKQTGHKSLVMVQRYVRDAELFDDNAASGVGL